MVHFKYSPIYLSLFSLVLSEYIPYDCRRSSQRCGPPAQRGTCLTETGSCQCPSGYQGFDCTLRTDSVIAPASCNVDCGGRGTCFSEAGNPTNQCYCDAAYYGDNCQFDRVSVECFPNSMIVRVFPQGFAGEVYVTNLLPLDVPECEFQPAPDNNGLIKNLSISEDNNENPCAPNLSVLTNSRDGTSIFTYDITVRYNPLYSTFVDELHTVTCEHTTNGPLLGAIVNVGGGPTNGVSINGSTEVVDLDVLRDSDSMSVVQNNIVVGMGEEITIAVTLDPTSRYENHRVEDCGAYNVPLEPEVNPNRLEKPLVLDGCPADGSLDVLRGSLTKTDNVISIPLRAFRFSTGELFLYCSVRVCRLATDPLCLPTDCSSQYGGAGSGFGRKKRASKDGEHVKTIQRRIFVVSSDEMRTAARSTHTIETESCLQSVAFLTITGVLVLMLVLVLVVTVTLVVKFKGRERDLTKGKYSEKP